MSAPCEQSVMVLPEPLALPYCVSTMNSLLAKLGLLARTSGPRTVCSNYERLFSNLTTETKTLANQALNTLHPHRCASSRLFSSVTQDSSPSTGAPEPDDLYKTIQVEVRGHDPSVLKSYEFFATEAAKLLNILHTSETPPKIIDKWTLLKSRHNYGKYHKVQYEARTHFKVINLTNLTGSTADTYLEYIQRNLPEGVAMKVTKTRIEAFPVHIKPPSPSQEHAVE